MAPLSHRPFQLFPPEHDRSRTLKKHILFAHGLLLIFLSVGCIFLSPEVFLPFALWLLVLDLFFFSKKKRQRLLTRGEHVVWTILLLCGVALFSWWLINSWPFLISRTATFWDFGSSRLPPQPTLVVLVEYLLLGVTHGLLILRSGCCSRDVDDVLVDSVRQFTRFCGAIFHGICAVWAVVLPVCYLTLTGQEMRLHHSFTGLLMQALPLTPLQVFGTVMTLDSSLYLIHHQRGHWVQPIVNSSLLLLPKGEHSLHDIPTAARFESYDFMNIVSEHLSFVVSGLAIMSLVHILLRKFF